jgi:protocatechuate 3,4-dioxygenase beta subunit
MLRAIAAAATLPALAVLVIEPVVAQRASPSPRPVTVRGRIIAADTGEAISNARVAVKGRPGAARTNVDGRFAAPAPNSASIVVTKAGYLPAEVPVARANEIPMTRAAAISGRVVDDRGDPIVGALVVAATPDKIEAPARESARISTDDRGEYRIGGLPPGTYIVSITMAGAEVETRDVGNGITSVGPAQYRTFFADTADRDGAARVSLRPGDERADVDFHLVSSALSPMRDGLPMRIVPNARARSRDGASSISGTITSTSGTPLRARVVMYADNPLLLADRATTSDDDGRYEFSGLPAGTYRIAAARPGFSMPPDKLPRFGLAGLGVEAVVGSDDDRDRVDLALQPWGAISGRVLDEAGDPVQGAYVGLMTVRYERGRRRLVPAASPQRYTNDRGEFRIYAVPPGQYVLAASVGDTLAFDVTGYGPTFYPGTGAAAEARFITVRIGDEIAALDFGLVAAATASLSGTLVDAAGKPTTGGQFNLIPRSALSSRIDARIGEDGHFTFRNVPPGQYVIQADRGRRGASVEGEFGAFPVIVGGGDVSGLMLQTSIGSRIAGRVTFDSATASATPAGSVSISPVPADYDLAPQSIAVGEPDRDGHFELRGIHGARRLQVTRLPSGWSVRTIVSSGRNITDDVLEFGRGDQSLEDVEVILTDRVSEVVGRVADERGRAVSTAAVIVFSTDRNRWYPASRFMRTTTTTVDGAFRISGLPAGSYFVAAVLTTPSGDDAWGDPAFLDTLRPRATVLSLSDDQAQSVTLRVGE